MFEAAIVQVAFLLGIVGAVLITVGSIEAIVSILRAEFARKQKFRRYESAKRVFVQKLIFGLDFFIAGDIIRTIALSAFDDLTRLAIIVAIRSILSFFLAREVHLHKE